MSASTDRRFERRDDGLESKVFQVLLVLTTDRSVLRNDRSGHVRTAEIDADSRLHGRYLLRFAKAVPARRGNRRLVMETIDLINLRNYTRRTGQPTHPELLDARPLEHVNKIEIDEEHITIEFDEKTTRYYNANEITHREWVYKYNDDPEFVAAVGTRHRARARAPQGHAREHRVPARLRRVLQRLRAVRQQGRRAAHRRSSRNDVTTK